MPGEGPRPVPNCSSHVCHHVCGLPGEREGPGVRGRVRVWMGLGVFITKSQVWLGERFGGAPECSSLLTASWSAALG